jgi:phosphatidylinositol glycan class U
MLLVTSPVSQLASPQEFRGDLRTACKYAGQFAMYWLVLFGAASVMVGGEWGWLRETWGARFVFSRRIGLDLHCEQPYCDNLTLPDLTPNPGLWLNFFTEMFNHFRPFFLMVFSVRTIHWILFTSFSCVSLQRSTS